MKIWLLRHRRILETVLSLGVAFFSGVYINFLTTIIEKSADQSFYKMVIVLGWWNTLPVFALACVLSIYYLGNQQSRMMRSNLEHIIQEILAAASRSIIYPSSHHHIRAIITLYDPKKNVRITKYSYNTEPDPERTGVFPPDFGITGKAFKGRCVIIEELTSAHHADYPEEVKGSVFPKVRTIIAAPLLMSLDRSAIPMGVLAFDSILPISKLVKDDEEMRHIAQKWADVISSILLISGES